MLDAPDVDVASSLRTVLVVAPLALGMATLDADEGHHARTVLRLRADDRVRVADGAGRAGSAIVRVSTRSRCDLEVLTVEDLPAPRVSALTVALAPPKGDRAGDVVRGLCELGVGAIWFVHCERSGREPALERMERIVREALKQCRRGHLPALRGGLTLDQVIAAGPLCFADPEGEPARPGAVRPQTLVIGPEGGFSAAERSRLRAGGGLATRLAAPILRIETAALAGAAVWAAAWDGTDAAPQERT